MSPLTKKGAKIKRAMTKQYGKTRGTRIFYASSNAGTIKGVHKKREEALMGVDDVYDADAEQQRLFDIVARWYLSMLRGVHALIGSAFPEVEGFRLDDEATRLVLDAAAERVVLIDTATRAALRDQLKEGQQRGYSAFQLATGVPAEDFRGIDGLFATTWQGRAETVALTELAQARAVASLNRYEATGLVDEVEIVEHADTDEPCARRNGQVVPLSERPLPLHPRCQMGLIPRVRADAAA